MKSYLFLTVACLFLVASCSKIDMKIMHGSFLQPYLAELWGNASGFKTEFQYMKEVKLSHVILQWTINSKRKQAWYPTSFKGYKQMLSYDMVETALSEASKNNMTVWLGLNNNDDWWVYGATNETWLKEQFDIGKELAGDLWNKYGSKYASTIAGFYIMFEMDNIAFLNETEQQRMAIVYKDLVEHVRKKSNKQIMVAPYFVEEFETRVLNPLEFAQMWKKILLFAPLGVIALQDGIGVGHSNFTNIGKWFYHMKLMLDEIKSSTELWTDIETFEDIDSSIKPAPVERVIKQIEVERQYVSRITSFSFNHFYSPQQGSPKEFNEYKQYVLNH